MTGHETASSGIAGPKRIFVISGPSGVGKNTLADIIVGNGAAIRAVTATTRDPRPGENDGVDYFFVDETRFRRWMKDGQLIEWNRYGGHLYGTPIFSVKAAAASGRPVLLVIDVNGALKAREAMEGAATLIFIQPPSIRVLEERLRNRGDVDEQGIRKRLAIAGEEMKLKHKYDYTVVNGRLEDAAGELERIIRGVFIAGN